MPPDGYVSITVHEEFYLEIQNQYEKNKDILRRIGIHSTSGFYTAMIESLMTDDNLYNLVLEKFTKDINLALQEMKK